MKIIILIMLFAISLNAQVKIVFLDEDELSVDVDVDVDVDTISTTNAIDKDFELTELVANGGFDADTDWSMQAEWSIADGVASCVGVIGGQQIWQGITHTVGYPHRLTFDVDAYTSGTLKYTLGTSTLAGEITATGSYSYVYSGMSYDYIKFRGQAAPNLFTGSIDNVSVTTFPSYATINNSFDVPSFDVTTVNPITGVYSGVITVALDTNDRVTNGDMELDAWWEGQSSPATAEQSTDMVYAGTYSWKVESTTGGGVGITSSLSDQIILETGKTYTVEAYIWIVSGDVRIRIYTEGYIEHWNSATTGEWLPVSFSFTPTVFTEGDGTTYLYFEARTGNALFYVDDVSILMTDADIDNSYLSLPAAKYTTLIEGNNAYLSFNALASTTGVNITMVIGEESNTWVDVDNVSEELLEWQFTVSASEVGKDIKFYLNKIANVKIDDFGN